MINEKKVQTLYSVCTKETLIKLEKADSERFFTR